MVVCKTVLKWHPSASLLCAFRTGGKLASGSGRPFTGGVPRGQKCYEECSEEFVHHWEKEAIHRPAPVQNLSLQEKWGPQRKDFGGGYGLPGFYRVFVSTTGLESFFFEARKVLQKIFFRWWLCTLFFLLCTRLVKECFEALRSSKMSQ